MICDEVVTIQDDTRPPTLLVDQYQARIDLLHSIHPTNEDPEPVPAGEAASTKDVSSEDAD